MRIPGAINSMSSRRKNHSLWNRDHSMREENLGPDIEDHGNSCKENDVVRVDHGLECINETESHYLRGFT
jgi:hypothetical protein